MGPIRKTIVVIEIGGPKGIRTPDLCIIWFASTPDGDLALTDHPAVFGNKLTNPTITTDFAESQLEAGGFSKSGPAGPGGGRFGVD